MNMQQKMKMLALLNEMQSILLEGDGSPDASPALPPLPSQTPQEQRHEENFAALNLNLDIPAEAEMDALALYQQGLDKARNLEIQGWNSGQQAQAYAWQADRVDPTAGMIGTALSGIAQAGPTSVAGRGAGKSGGTKSFGDTKTTVTSSNLKWW